MSKIRDLVYYYLQQQKIGLYWYSGPRPTTTTGHDSRKEGQSQKVVGGSPLYYYEMCVDYF